MDRQLLLAVTLSVLVVVAYQWYLDQYYPQTGPVPTPAPSSQPAAEAVPPPPSGEVAPVPASPSSGAPVASASGTERAERPEADLRIETGELVARISSRGGRLVSLRLKDYRTSVAADSPPLEMITELPVEYPLGVTLRGADTAWTDRDVLYEADRPRVRVEGEGTARLALEGRLPEGGTIRKVFTVEGGRYSIGVAVELEGAPADLREVALSWRQHLGELAGQRARWTATQALVGRKLVDLDEDDLARGVVIANSGGGDFPVGPIHWAAYADTYFLSAILPDPERPRRLWAKQTDDVLTMELLQPVAESAGSYQFRAFAGPKDLDVLRMAGTRLERGLDLGFFGIVAEPMLRVLKFFHRLTGNYGIDIILLTVVIKILFIPLQKKSFESMQAMQKLQPQMKRLQEQYKDEREELNKQLMELYKRHKVNPLGGCLPMVLQMPVFIGLYNALFYAVELRHAPFFLWINDLSAPDRLPAVPADPLAVIAGIDIRIPVLTLLMGASMLIQQKMTPSMGDPAQQRMMMLMPVVFTVMFVSFPSGLVLYWLINNVLTIAQQAWMRPAAARS